jgi:hypothetical protein
VTRSRTRRTERRRFGTTEPTRADGAGFIAARRNDGPIRQALRAGIVQTKLALSGPTDRCERDADRAAEAVMRGAAAPSGAEGAATEAQRACATHEQGRDDRVARAAAPESEEEKRRREREARDRAAVEARRHEDERKRKTARNGDKAAHADPREGRDDDRRREEEDTLVRAKAEPGTAVTPADADAARMADAELAVRDLSGGQPLPGHLAGLLGMRFGRRFDAVRIHTDADAGRTARDIGALAFTFQDHVVFAPGRYRPDTAAGRMLLAHELAHVVQQGYAPAQDSTADPGRAARPADRGKSCGGGQKGTGGSSS